MGLNKNRSAVIVGAGIGGLTAAIALRRSGFSVRVLERADAFRPVGAGLMVQPNAMLALAELGVAEAVLAEGERLLAGRILLRDTPLLSLPFEEVAERIGAPCVAIHRARLHALLLDSLGDGCVTLGARVASVAEENNSVSVRLAEGESLTADIVVGADGIHSSVRRCLWGDEEIRHSGYTAWRGLCANRGVWPGGEIIERWGDQQLFGATKISEELTYWFATQAVAPKASAPPANRKEQVEQLFHGWPRQVTGLIAKTPDDAIFRNDIYDRPPRFPWGKGRVTLLGDAIHPMTPNMGQGACQAIEDAVVLGHGLARSNNLEEDLRRYERKRHPRTKTFVQRSRQLTALAHGRNALARAARSWVLPRLPKSLQLRQLESLCRFDL